MCDKGLVMDIANGSANGSAKLHNDRKKRNNEHKDIRDNGYFYALSPFVFGFFEFTMMRVGPDLPYRTWAKLLHDYLSDDGSIYKANFSHGEILGIGRTVPHEETVIGVTAENSSEILDYESALALVDRSSAAAVGICSCRHEKLHTDTKTCKFDLETCLSFGEGANFLVRHNLARPLSKEEAKASLARGKAAGLVLIADNVRKDVSFICQCCGCCCGMLQGINKFGFLNAVTTSNYIAHIEIPQCTGCGKCARVCPVKAISMTQKIPAIDNERCLGCGVCATLCTFKAIQLHPRAKRAYHPEDFFERALISNLELGTLQNFVFNNPNSKKQEFLRLITGAFLRLPPVRQTLVSDLFRSRFLGFMRSRGKAKK
jgi:Fe-S-cluster-containing hydrogenase component 2